MKGKVWVLDTETKGTGAQMVPLESTRSKPQPKEHLLSPRTHRPRPEPEPQPRAPRRFKVVDITTRETLAEDADAAATFELLGGVRSEVDVNLYVWEDEDERWRLLTLRERRLLWELRRPRT